MDRNSVGVAGVAPVLRASLGREPVAVERLAGGSKKGVYRVTLDGGRTAVLYVWSAEENYWPARDAPEDIFADASGLDLFQAAYDMLASVGVRTPRLLWADDSHDGFPADVAVVEDVRGGTLEDRLARAPAPSTLDKLRSALARMAAVREPRLGKVGKPDRSDRTCADVILDGARRDLSEAAARVPALRARRSALADRLDALAAGIQPRPTQALVHGELGPDHVLLDDADQPVLIDIEGLAFFDPEWEHAFLEMRFGAAYPALRLPNLDQARLRLYRLARHLIPRRRTTAAARRRLSRPRRHARDRPSAHRPSPLPPGLTTTASPGRRCRSARPETTVDSHTKPLWTVTPSPSCRRHPLS